MAPAIAMGFRRTIGALCHRPVSTAARQLSTLTPPRETSIMLFASEVSIITGANPYKQPGEVFESVWKRTWPARFNAAKSVAEHAQQAPVLSREESAQRIIVDHDLQAPLQQALDVAASSAASVGDLREAKKELASAISGLEAPAEMKQEVLQHAMSQANTTFGTHNEARAIKKFEFQARTKVRSNNAKFFKKDLGHTHPGGTPWALGGRIDGFDGARLVEIKNRTNRFIEPLPEYDITQFQCYLHLLDLEEGELVENLKTPTPEEQEEGTMRRTPLQRNEALWDAVIRPRMELFCDFLDQFCQEQQLEAQAEYLQLGPEQKLEFLAPISYRSAENYYESGNYVPSDTPI